MPEEAGVSESIESVRVGDPGRTGDPATTPLEGASVRELLTELAELEDATRGPRGATCATGTEPYTDLLAALAREQEIIDELHARCPDAQHARSREADGPPALG